MHALDQNAELCETAGPLSYNFDFTLKTFSFSLVVHTFDIIYQ